jgi:hypothetical protein
MKPEPRDRETYATDMRASDPIAGPGRAAGEETPTGHASRRRITPGPHDRIAVGGNHRGDVVLGPGTEQEAG